MLMQEGIAWELGLVVLSFLLAKYKKAPLFLIVLFAAGVGAIA